MRWWLVLLAGCGSPPEGPPQRRVSDADADTDTDADADGDTDADTGSDEGPCPFEGDWAIEEAGCSFLNPIDLTGTVSVTGTASLCEFQIAAHYVDNVGGICDHTETAILQGLPLDLWEGFTEGTSDCWTTEARPMGFVGVSFDADGLLLLADGQIDDDPAGFHTLAFCISEQVMLLTPL